MNDTYIDILDALMMGYGIACYQATRDDEYEPTLLVYTYHGATQRGLPRHYHPNPTVRAAALIQAQRNARQITQGYQATVA